VSEADLTITCSIVIRARPELVWRVLTEPECVSQWLGCMRYEKAVGHVFYMQQDASRRDNDDIDGATHCEILALDEPEVFSFSWYLPDTPTTEVQITLRAQDAYTEVSLVHGGWAKFDAEFILGIRDALEKGWQSVVLPNLKKAVESR
jgi:uncharacterized protein YndB with AHSA1/START domain